jgi:ribosomal protein S12 methylthiotransferase
MPLQHINDRMLRLMARRVTRDETVQLLERLRREVPELVIRTTFIVGFPGETEAEFNELYDFVAPGTFERVGVFEYSYEPGTPATRLSDHLPDELKAERRARLMELQQQVAFAWNQRQIGREIEVLIDTAVTGHKGLWVGRGIADAPEVDSLVYVQGHKLKPGMFARVQIVGTQDYDLVGKEIRSKH